MPHDLIAQPVHEMLAALRDALDAIDCGIVLFAPDMRVRFANRRFAELQAVAREVLIGQDFRDLFGQATADPCRAAPHDAVRAHIQQRETAIRAGTVASSVLDLDDGRRLLFRYIPGADKGRILTCTDITWMRQQEDQQHAARDAAERTDVEFRFNKETLEDQASYLASLAEESDANARRAEQARHRLEREIAGRRQLEAELRRLAATDALTGTLNRRRFFELGQRKLSRGPDIKQEIAVLMVDIDHFKLINDRHGHPVGDEALKHVVSRLRSALRRVDLIGRLGGEEFAIMLPAYHRSGRVECRRAPARRRRDGTTGAGKRADPHDDQRRPCDDTRRGQHHRADHRARRCTALQSQGRWTGSRLPLGA